MNDRQTSFLIGTVGGGGGASVVTGAIPVVRIVVPPRSRWWRFRFWLGQLILPN